MRHPLYSEIVHGDYFPVSYCSRDEVYSQWTANELPVVRDRDEQRGLPKLITKKLVIRGQNVGFLHVIEFCRKFHTNAPYITELLGNLAVIQQAAVPGFLQSASRRSGQLFRDILESVEPPQQRTIEKQAKELGIKLRPNYRFIILVETENQEGPGTPVQTLTLEAESAVPGAWAFLYKNSVCLICPFSEGPENMSSRLSGLFQLLRNNGMMAGISATFHSLRDLRKFSYQALKALEIGRIFRKTDVAYYYQDYALFHMIESSCAGGMYEDFCMPELFTLLEYCRENGPELLDTLRIYLDCRCSKAQTAERLGLHPHTVKYRVEQLQNIMGIDLDDSDTLIHLVMSLKMTDFYENAHNSELPLNPPPDPGVIGRTERRE